MITARTPARRLTWILLPAPGLDLQPQTQTAFYILARRVGFCKIFLFEGAAHVPVNGAKNCINARKVTGSGYCGGLRGAPSPPRGITSACVGRLHRRGVLRVLAWGSFTDAGYCAFPLRCCFKRNLDGFYENQVYVLNFPLFCIFILI